MRSSSLARVVFAGLAVSVVITLGCGEPPTGPTPLPGLQVPSPSPPSTPPTPQQRAALHLFDAAIVHASVTTSPLMWTTADGKAWTNGPCFGGRGSVQGTLDGGVLPTPGTLPTGSHTYVVSFSNCFTEGFGVVLNGVASAAYSAAGWSNVTATVSAHSVRIQYGGGNPDDLDDMTADGSAVWTSVGSRTETTSNTTRYTPATGSRLVNNFTTNVATFGGGSYSKISYPGNRWEWRFDDLKVAINGTEYTLNGSLEFISAGPVGSSRPYPTYTGEVRITNNGALVARIYGDAQNNRAIEVLAPLVPL